MRFLEDEDSLPNEYAPDRWLIVQIVDGVTKEVETTKLFGTWAGGYTTGDYWRLNSEISRVETPSEDLLTFGSDYSTSVYHCFKHSYGSTGYGLAVLAERQVQVEQNTSKQLIILEEEEAFEFIHKLQHIKLSVNKI